ncbi:MAG: alcohol acetyltransferase [Moorea sp. SIO4E2]|nr:alcohol acetyltransferase [Moorena sp. SIO4E2]
MIDNRKLCAVEQVMEIVNRLNSSLNIVIIGRILGPLNEEIVRQAFDIVQTHHPRLNSRIVGDVDNLRFETGAKKIPLRVVEKEYEGKWQETLLEELNTQIESSEVLLRAVLVQEQELGENSASHLIITIHHAITDALSSIQLYSELLSYCSKVASGEPVVPVPNLPTLPPVDELLPPSTKGFRGNINKLLFVLRLLFKNIWHQPKGLSFEKTVPLELRRTGNVYRQLDAEVTKELILRCRQEKTTVQGALCAALIFATAIKIGSGKKKYVSCWIPVDLRKHLKPVIGNENMVLLVGPITSFHTLDTNTSFWELAREVRQQVEVGLKRGDMFSGVLMYKKMFELALTRRDQAPQTVSISNIGRVNIPRVYGQFELSEISFASGQAMFGGLVLAYVTTFEGKMFLHFPFSKPAISQETMETLVDSFLSYLVDASKVKISPWAS